MNSQNKSQPMYILDFNGTMTLVTGYNAVLRSKVIDRWIELEKAEAQPAFKVPTNYEEALEQLLEKERENRELLLSGEFQHTSLTVHIKSVP